MACPVSGVNNYPLIAGAGQFGDRDDGIAAADSARYLYVSLTPNFLSALLPAADMELLTLAREDGQDAEPIHLLPIIPLCLINGSVGITLGYRSLIPPTLHSANDCLAACSSAQ